MFGKRNSGGTSPSTTPRRRSSDLPTTPLPVPADGQSAVAPAALQPPSARVQALLKTVYPEVRGASLPLTLNAIGALAGFTAQQGIWHAIKSGSLEEIDRPARTTLKDGCICYRGRTLERMVVGSDKSVASIWSIVSAGALAAGCSREGLPDISDMVAYSPWGRCVSVPEGAPALERLIAQMRTARGGPNPLLRWVEQPIAVLIGLWPDAGAILQNSPLEPIKWSTELAVIAQRLIVASKTTLAPSVGARLVMEPAISMAGIDPILVPGAPYDDDRKHLGDRYVL